MHINSASVQPPRHSEMALVLQGTGGLWLETFLIDKTQMIVKTRLNRMVIIRWMYEIANAQVFKLGLHGALSVEL